MIVVDANVLLYAFDTTSSRHQSAKAWLERALSGSEAIGLPLVSVLAFLRIGTDARVFDVPLEPAEAIAIVSSWLGRGNVSILHPTSRHWLVFGETVEAGRARGPLMMDAHVATLTKEYGATLATTDRDFARFPRLDLVDPTTD